MRRKGWAWDSKNGKNGVYWHYDYRHYMRDIGKAKRKKILQEMYKAKLDPEGKSAKHLYIIQKYGEFK